MTRQRRSVLPYILFVFALCGLLIALAIGWSRPPSSGGSTAKPADFATALKEREPLFTSQEQACPVCGTPLSVPLKDNPRQHSNMFGGVGSDNTPIALAPGKDGSGAPDPDCQDYDKLLVGCPHCKAHYNGLDVFNFSGGSPAAAVGNLRSQWDAQKLCPGLASKAEDKLFLDERAFLRYLTTSVAYSGDDQKEIALSFAALDGASTANLSVYLGRDYSIGPAAFYALCAAHCEAALAADATLVEQNARGAVMLAMQAGECHRLLGRKDAGAADFAKARGWIEAESAKLESELAAAKAAKQEQQIYDKSYLLDFAKAQLHSLDQLEAWLKAGDFHLHRLKARKERKPPIGWYIEQMLPAINGQLDADRAEWAGLGSPEEIVSQVNSRLAASSGAAPQT